MASRLAIQTTMLLRDSAVSPLRRRAAPPRARGRAHAGRDERVRGRALRASRPTRNACARSGWQREARSASAASANPRRSTWTPPVRARRLALAPSPAREARLRRRVSARASPRCRLARPAVCAASTSRASPPRRLCASCRTPSRTRAIAMTNVAASRFLTRHPSPARRWPRRSPCARSASPCTRSGLCTAARSRGGTGPAPAVCSTTRTRWGTSPPSTTSATRGA